MQKKCTKCLEVKDLQQFTKDIRYSKGCRSRCKACCSQYVKDNQKHINFLARKRYDPNKERERSRNRKQYKKESDHQYYLLNKERIIEQCRVYACKPGRKERVNALRKSRRENDPGYRIENRLRVRLYYALKGVLKVDATKKLVGCSIETLKDHFENHFSDGMSWDKIGEWHIDHIRPCASFDLSDPAQQRECFHYSNLQPLRAADNLRKSATMQKIEAQVN